MASVTVSQMSTVRMGVAIGRPARSGINVLPARLPMGQRTRQTLVVRSVAKPSGSGKQPVAVAASSSGGLSKLKQLVTPFSDPQANSKMLALATGKASFLP